MNTSIRQWRRKRSGGSEPSSEEKAPDDVTKNSGPVLVMTVGTGDLTRIEETLFTPLRKSIATDAWTRVILLPSGMTEEFAEKLRNGLETVDAAIRALPAGDENDADRAYAHFDAVLAEVLQATPPHRVVVDFTRGTKAMSAALVLAATRREVPHLRYVTGPRDHRGMVKAGSEEVRQIRTTVAAGHRRLDLARDLMLRGNFPAAEAVLPDPEHPFAEIFPHDVIRVAGAVRTVARFYAAWDRLDYAAASSAAIAGTPTDEWKTLWPVSAARDWVCALARKTDRSDCGAMAARVRRLVIDLLANGERRLRHGQHEDALVRAYRVLELIGQARLFDHGLDSGDLDGTRRAVQRLQRKIEKKNQAPLAVGRSGALQAGRFQVARLLKECEDPLAERLLAFEREALLKPTLRNDSVLIHGFVARAPENAESLRSLFQKLAQLAEADGDPESFDEWLSIARTPVLEGTERCKAPGKDGAPC